MTDAQGSTTSVDGELAELPPEELVELIRAPKVEPDLMRQVLRRAQQLGEPSCSTILTLLAVRAGTPPDVLGELAEHPSASIRREVIRREDTPPAALRLLADRALASSKPAWAAAEALTLARNPTTPSDVLARFAEHEDLALVHLAAAHNNLPPESAVRLAEALTSMLAAPEEGLRDEYVGIALALILNPATPEKALLLLAPHQHFAIRAWLRLRDNVPESVQVVLQLTEQPAA